MLGSLILLEDEIKRRRKKRGREEEIRKEIFQEPNLRKPCGCGIGP